MYCKNCKRISLGFCCNLPEINHYEVIHRPQKMALDISVETANTTEVHCPNCNSTNLQIKVFQNRTADESSTVRIICFNCGFRSSE